MKLYKIKAYLRYWHTRITSLANTVFRGIRSFLRVPHEAFVKISPHYRWWHEQPHHMKVHRHIRNFSALIGFAVIFGYTIASYQTIKYITTPYSAQASDDSKIWTSSADFTTDWTLSTTAVSNNSIKLAEAGGGAGGFSVVSSDPNLGGGVLGPMDGSSASNIWIGDSGSNVHEWNGSNWVLHSNVMAPASVAVVKTFGPDDTWIFDSLGRCRHWTGTWSAIDSVTGGDPFVAAWASGSNDMWLGTTGPLWHWTGSWAADYSVAGVSAITGTSSNDIWATSIGMYTFHYDGLSWTNTYNIYTNGAYTAANSDVWLFDKSSNNLYHKTSGDPVAGTIPLDTAWSMAGTGAADVWAVGPKNGANKSWAHWNGASWTLGGANDPGENLTGVLAFSSSSVYVSSGAHLYSWTPAGTTYSSPGTASATYAVPGGAKAIWTSATPVTTTPASTTAGVKYASTSTTCDSTEYGSNSNWKSDITTVAVSSTLYLCAKLTTTDNTVTPSLDSLQVNYTTITATVSAPNGGETIQFNNSKTTPISWSATGTSAVDHVHLQYSVNSGSSYSDITGATSLGTGASPYSWTIYTDRQTSSATVKIKVILENSGNVELASDVSDAVFSLVYDNTAPTLTFVSAVSDNVSPASTAAAHVSNVVTATFTTSESLAAQPTVTLGGQSMTYFSIAGGSPPYTYVYKRTITGTETESTTSPIAISGSDAAGNSGSTSSTFSLDFTRPTIAITSSNPTPTSLSSTTISGTATDTGGSGIAAVVSTPAAAVTGLGPWSQVVSLSAGSNTFSYLSTDIAGNTALSSASVTIVRDSVAPTISNLHLSSSYRNHFAAKTGDTITVTFTVSEALDGDPVVKFDNGNSTDKDVALSSKSGLDYTYTRLVDWTDLTGALVVNVTAVKDLAGNEGNYNSATYTVDSNAVTSSLVVDLSAPTIDYGAGFSNDGLGHYSDIYTTEPTTVLSGSASDNSGIGIESVSSSDSGTVTGTTSWSQTVALNDGDNNYSYTVTDYAGNAATTSNIKIFKDGDPTGPPTPFTATCGVSSCDIAFGTPTQGGVGAIALISNYIVVVKKANTFTSPTRGVDYSTATNQATLGAMSVVYLTSADHGYTFTGLNAQTKYYFAVYAVRTGLYTSGNIPLYSSAATTDGTTTGTTPPPTPPDNPPVVPPDVPNDPAAPNVTVAVFSPSRVVNSARSGVWSVSSGAVYQSLRTILADQANFGANGKVKKTIRYRDIDTVTPASLSGADILIISPLANGKELSRIEIALIEQYVKQGGNLLESRNIHSASTRPAILGTLGGTFVGDARPTVTLSGIGSPIMAGPFGVVSGTIGFGANGALSQTGGGTVVMTNKTGPDMVMFKGARDYPSSANYSGDGNSLIITDEEIFMDGVFPGEFAGQIKFEANQKILKNTFAFLLQHSPITPEPTYTADALTNFRSSIGARSVVLSFDAPPAGAVADIYRSNNKDSRGELIATIVGNGLNSSYIDNTIRPDTLYYYTAVVRWPSVGLSSPETKTGPVSVNRTYSIQIRSSISGTDSLISLLVGQKTSVNASVFDNFSDQPIPGAVVTWSVDNQSLAIDAGGVLTGVAVGGSDTALKAAYQSPSGVIERSVPVYVIARNVIVSAGLTPSSQTIKPGAKLQYRFELYNQNGVTSQASDLGYTVKYSATGGSIDGSGLYTAGTNQGGFLINAVATNGAEEWYGTARVTISSEKLYINGAAMVVNPRVPKGTQFRMWSYPYDQFNNYLGGVYAKNVTYSNSDPEIGYIDKNGMFYANNQEKCDDWVIRVEYEYDGYSAHTAARVSTLSYTQAERDLYNNKIYVQFTPSSYIWALKPGEVHQYVGGVVNGYGVSLPGKQLVWEMVDPKAGSITPNGVFTPANTEKIYVRAIKLSIKDINSGLVTPYGLYTVAISSQGSRVARVVTNSVVMKPYSYGYTSPASYDQFGFGMNASRAYFDIDAINGGGSITGYSQVVSGSAGIYKYTLNANMVMYGDGSTTTKDRGNISALDSNQSWPANWCTTGTGGGGTGTNGDNPDNPYIGSPTGQIVLPGSIVDEAIKTEDSILGRIIRGLTKGMSAPIGLAIASALAIIAALPAITSFLLDLIAKILGLLTFLSPRQRRRTVGLVLNKKSSKPIVAATVELLDTVSKIVIDSQRTDAKGQYTALVDKDPSKTYFLQVRADGFDTYKRTVHYDEIHQTIRLGMSLEYDQKRLVRFRRWQAAIHLLAALRIPLLVFGTGVWMANVLLNGLSLVNDLLGGYYLLAWVLEWYVSHLPRPYGVIKDSSTGQPLSLVVVRIINQDEKVVATEVTNIRGQFKALLMRGIYKFTYSKSGYIQKVQTGVVLDKSASTLNIDTEMEMDKTEA